MNPLASALAPCVSALTTCLCLLSVCVPLSLAPGAMDAMDQHKSKVKLIDVKPGAGRQEIVESWGEFSCRFEYKAQGGTNEQWNLAMARNKKGTEWICVVERPSGLSYLFFEEFKLQVFGADLQEFLLEAKPGVRLLNEEYVVMMAENYVQHGYKFNSQLIKVQLYATSKKRLSTKEL